MHEVSGAGSQDMLIAAAARGDEAAWQSLWASVEPPLLRIVARPGFLGRLGQHEDDRRNIVVAVMARLRADDFKRLHLYLEARRTNERLTFLSWLRVVAKRVGIDYLRAHPDWVRRTEPDASTPGRWIDAGELPPESLLGGARPPVTAHGTAHELIAYAKDAVTPEQLRALELWSASESFAEIAVVLGLPGAADAERTVRAALERLRRHYRPAAE
jgi:DNA-directed RNA polymerase specialized sigma24 family protein